MSLGFVGEKHGVRRLPRQIEEGGSVLEQASEMRTSVERTMPNEVSTVVKWRNIGIIALLVFQACLDLSIFVIVGMTLKWCLTFDQDCAPHSHPHEEHENYIQRPNNILSIIMAAVILDFVEPFLLLVWYCRTKARKRRNATPRFTRCFGCLRVVFFFWSWLCIILIGMSLAAAWALQQENMPPDLRPNRLIGHDTLNRPCELTCIPATPGTVVTFAGVPDGTPRNWHLPGGFEGCTDFLHLVPHFDGMTVDSAGTLNFHPPAPPPQRPLLEPGLLYLTYSLLGLTALVKLTSYWLGYPVAVYEWIFSSLY